MSETFVPPAGCTSRVVYQASSEAVSVQETPEQRLMRLYAAEGGPLLGWLFDECDRRGQTRKELAAELGVTYSYLYQLRCGVRQTRHLSSDVASACAEYLGVPPVVVKLLAGALPMSDFVWPAQSEEAVMDRALDTMKVDPVARALIPADVKSLPLAAKRSLVLMYAESSRQDVFGVRQLPDVLQWLQRAAVVHDDNEARAMA
jgi:transcriptional regulator with XRE-family HTH domain